MYYAAQKVPKGGWWWAWEKGTTVNHIAWLIKLKILFHVAFNLVQFIAPWKIDLKHQMQKILQKGSKV